MTRARTDIHPFDQQQPRAPVPRIMARQDRGTDMSDANKVEMLKKSKTVKNTELDIPAIEAGEKCNPLLINKPPPSVSGLRAVETEVSPVTAASKIAPITVGNPARPPIWRSTKRTWKKSRTRTQNLPSSNVSGRQRATSSPCGRSPKSRGRIVRYYFLLQLEGRDPYIVASGNREEEERRRGHDPPRAGRPLRDDGGRGGLVAAQAEPVPTASPTPGILPRSKF